MKYPSIIVLFAAISLLAGAPALAHSASEIEVGLNDLGIEDPGLLPTNPFYFLKEWGRGARRLFTFNPVSKVELELKFANEKAAEVKKVEETAPANVRAVTKALENYQKSQARLQNRLENLKEDSKNPQVEKLLENLADQNVKHVKVVETLIKKFENEAAVEELAKKVKERIEETTVTGAEKDDPEKFAAKLEKALVATKGGELKHLQSVELIDRLERKSPEEIKKSLGRLREDFQKRLEKDFEEFVEIKGVEELKERVQELPGDLERRSVLLEELKQKAEGRVSEFVERASEALEKVAINEERAWKRAKEQIKSADGALVELNNKLEGREVGEAVKNLSSESRSHLEKARKAFEEGDYGEAFGQARSAEVLARNGLRMLEKLEEDESDLNEVKEVKNEIEAMENKVEKYGELVEDRDLEDYPKVREFLENTDLQLLFAKESLVKNDIVGVRLHLSRVRGFLNDLARFIEAGGRPALAPAPPEKKLICPAWSVASCGPGEKGVPGGKRSDGCDLPPRCISVSKELEPIKEKPMVCIQVYDPVCGVNGKTYSNSCTAEVAGVKVQYTGECGKAEEKKIEPKVEILEPTPAPPAVKLEEKIEILEPASVPVAPAETIQEFKLEADDLGFYPSGEIKASKDAKVKLHFLVRKDRVYYAGLDFRSDKFKTASIKPGDSVTVEFTANESFDFSSYWPASGVLKARGKVTIQ